MSYSGNIAAATGNQLFLSPIASTHGGVGQTTYNPGDILYADDVGELVTLPSGDEGYQLSIVGGALGWAPAGSGAGGAGGGGSSTLDVPIVSGWQSFSPAGAWDSYATYGDAFYRRVGDTMELRVSLTLTGTPVGTLTVNVPDGYSVDFNKIDEYSSVGRATLIDISPFGIVDGQSRVRAGDYFEVLGSNPGASTNSMSTVTPSAPFTWASTDVVRLTAVVPIDGWDETEEVIVTASGGGSSATLLTQMYLNANQGTGTGLVKVDVNATGADTASAADIANNRITIPASLNGKRVKIRGAVYWISTPLWSTTTDAVGVVIRHRDSGAATLGYYEESHPPVNGTNIQVAEVSSPSFVVSTGDYIELLGISLVYAEGRNYSGAASPNSYRCYIEMEVLD